MVLLLACTLQPGTGFATVSSASLDAAVAPGAARDLGDGWILTDLGYRVRFDEAALEVQSVDLAELVGGSSGFDPADPPEGYSLCHGGHCHHESGELVDYAVIEAELAGDTATFESVVAMPVEASVDLLGGAVLDLDRFAPSRELPATTIRQVRVHAHHVVLAGVVEATDFSADLEIDLELPEPLAGPYDLTVDRDSEPGLDLPVELVLDGTQLDGLDLADLADDGLIRFTTSMEEDAEQLRDALLAVEPSVAAEGSP